MEAPSVVVIGGGAAGIVAAWRAAILGARVVLFEKTPRLGTKILISGGGKCNITHDGPIEDVLRDFRPNEARFIRPACYRFTNTEIVEMLTSRGLEVYTRPDGRIFPVDKTAKDVVAILRTYLEDARVETKLDAAVTDIQSEENEVTGVVVDEQLVACKHVVIAVGGSSYPNSGTTGDGWKWAKALGHTIVPVRAALAPMYLKEPFVDRAGIALRDCTLRAKLNGKEIAKWRDDLLFSHQGVSGPTVLGISREVAENSSKGPVTLDVDLLPSETFEQCNDRILAWMRENPRKLVASLADEFVPSRLAPVLIADAKIDGTTISANFDKKSRNRLVATLKEWQLGTVRTVPLEKGEVVAGGVSLNEVDPQTMRSAKTKGLYLCGEVLDIAGPVGGYNLQAAFATGFVAGETAGVDAKLT